ncbi:hypothetical protein ACFQ3N_10385 [Virgibacillus byunsanensis]|uniref:Malate synthase n=1 Tax=Virgibacillus byunsanensis TaxID=570945 RepID=A0ABW3LLI7_9BACI
MKNVREKEWSIWTLPKDLQDRRVEITGPVDRKMIINALNSRAKVFMEDFEDATSPTWKNIINGQINLMDTIRREIDFQEDNGKSYTLYDEVAVLMVRPRGWHLDGRITKKNTFSKLLRFLRELVSEERFTKFLTLPAYEQLLKGGK